VVDRASDSFAFRRSFRPKHRRRADPPAARRGVLASTIVLVGYLFLKAFRVL